MIKAKSHRELYAKESNKVTFDMLFNKNIQSLVWQSLIIVLSLEETFTFPLYKMLKYMYREEPKEKDDENQKKEKSCWMRYLNSNFIVYNMFDLRGKKSSKFKFYFCQKKKHKFWEKAKIKIPKCPYKCGGNCKKIDV